MSSTRATAATLALIAIRPAFAGGVPTQILKEDPRLVSVTWDPPTTTIDPAYVKAAQAFLGNGLGDPRGGKFCRVSVSVGGPPFSPPPNAFEELGWVLADGKHAVLMDGLEYPIKAVLGSANLDRALDGVTNHVSADGYRLPAVTKATPALMLLAGRSDLAERAFRIANQGGEHSAFGLYLWLYDRIQCQVALAIRSREDANGLRWTRQLLTVSMVKTQNRFASRYPGSDPSPTLASTREFYLDVVRRAAHPKKEPLDLGWAKNLSTAKRTAQLIDYLDTVGGASANGQWNSNLAKDPVYRAIAAEGTAAVPALVDDLEHDKRFTRSVLVTSLIGFGGLGPRPFHRVTEVVRELLSEIWPQSNRWDKIDSGEMAIQLRRAWKVQRRLSPNERWAEILKDDGALSTLWVEACKNLVRPAPGVSVTSDPRTPVQDAGIHKARGREIADLMTKRATELASLRDGTANDLEKSSESLQIGDCLARWAPATSEATLSELSKAALGLANSWNGNSANWANFVAAPFGRLVTDRLLLRDRSALSDYESAIPHFIPAGWIQSGAFSPLWSFSQDPEMESVARRYMDSLTKRLNPPDPQVAVETVENFVRGSVHSPLLSLPPFRELLVSGFSNDAKVGDGWVDSASHAMMYFRLETRGTSLLSLPSDVNPPSGVHIDVRVGDYIANVVAGIKGAPEFCMIWPIEKRNAAKTKLIQWLRDDRRNWLATAKDSPLYSE